MPDHLIILGTSARAAAHSAIRAGYRPSAVDRFADADLARACPVHRTGADPDQFVAACASMPEGPWMYTGALENHPAVVDRIAAVRRLYGNPGHVLRQVRDPVRLADTLQQAGFPCPEVSTRVPDTRSGPWLCKPLASAGGAGITRIDLGNAARRNGSQTESRSESEERIREEEIIPALHPSDPSSGRRSEHPSAHSSLTLRVAMGRASAMAGACATDALNLGRGPAAAKRSRADCYYQRYIEGQPCSAVYVAAGDCARLVGVTAQLVGAPWTGATGFLYAGSVGPLALGPRVLATFERLGECLARQFGLIGLFGVDAILSGDEVWPVEVNPRYTASVEVLERAMGLSAIDLHVYACRLGRCQADRGQALSAPCGKAIVYASSPVCVSRRLVRYLDGLNRAGRWPHVADIPTIGQTIPAGHPVVSVFAHGATLACAQTHLEAHTRQVREMLDRLAAPIGRST